MPLYPTYMIYVTINLRECCVSGVMHAPLTRRPRTFGILVNTRNREISCTLVCIYHCPSTNVCVRILWKHCISQSDMLVCGNGMCDAYMQFTLSASSICLHVPLWLFSCDHIHEYLHIYTIGCACRNMTHMSNCKHIRAEHVLLPENICTVYQNTD